MKISDQLILINAALDKWVKGDGGYATVANDPVHLFALLQNAPGAVRCCTLFEKDVKRGEYEEAGEVDRTFKSVLSRGKGFLATVDLGLYQATGQGRALFDLCEEARDVIRGLSFDAETTEVTPNFHYMGVFRVNVNILLDAYELEYSIGCQLPAA